MKGKGVCERHTVVSAVRVHLVHVHIFPHCCDQMEDLTMLNVAKRVHKRGLAMMRQRSMQYSVRMIQDEITRCT